MANEQLKGAGSPVTLRERYLIYPGSPLPDLATPSAQAFLAEERRDQQSRPLFALIVRPGFPARLNVLRALKGVDCPGLMTLVEWGVVDWPPANRKVLAVIYARPLGGRVSTTLAADAKRLDEADALRKLINPLTAALKVLKAHNVTHRAIRPNNLFWATTDKDRIVLGDGATVPPAYEQPVLVETVDSAMAHPAGRGDGTSANDVYCFGATLALLLRGKVAAAQLDDDAVIRQKIGLGSYGVLVGDSRLPLPMIEILRGTLCDDHQERWTNESLDLWLSGRRLTPQLAKVDKRAARAFAFNNNEYPTARELSIAFSRNWDAAAPYILDGRVELWLRRSLDQNEKANSVAAVVQFAAAAIDKRYAADIAVAKVCMILDNSAPIRYRGLSAMPDGFGTLLALTVIERGDVRLIAETILREIPKAWFETRDAYSPDNSIIENRFRQQKGYLERASIGNGVERALYEMNEAMPCISPHTVDDYVIELRDLLPALNASAKKAEGKAWPIDRHVAAFIAARTTFDIERQLSDLSAPDPERSGMGMLNLLALIQWRLGQGGLHNLAAWIGGLMQPAINSFHSRDKRRSLEKEIPRVIREGSLVELSRLLENPEDRATDLQGFEQARMDWLAAQRELADIEAGRVSHHAEAARTAQQLAALISVTISLITISLLVIMKVF